MVRVSLRCGFIQAIEAAALIAGLAACPSGSAPTPGATGEGRGVPKDTVALVNGKPITAFEVALRQRSSPGARDRGGERGVPENPEAALEALVLQELQAQRAVELGLDAEPGFRAEVERAEAQLRDVRRRELAKLYRSKEVLEKSAVSDADARRYFDANTARVQSEFKVMQILVRGQAAIDAAAAALAQGKDFAEVAAAQFPELTPGQAPWDLPQLTWEQVPSQWWPELDKLEVGKVSAVIPAPGERFWLIKLVERRANLATTFEVAKPRIQALLKSARYEERRAQLDQELRAKAKVERLQPPVSGPGGAAAAF